MTDGTDVTLEQLQQLIDEQCAQVLHDRCHAVPAMQPPPEERPLLAMLSPLPPERSGISDYTASLLPALSRHYRIVLLHPEPAALEPVKDAWSEPLPLHSPDWLDRPEANSARIIYHFGNSPFHESMLSLIRRKPGVVVLHDYYLSHLLDSWARHGHASASLASLLYRCHGYPALQHYSRERSSGGHDHLWSYSLNQPVLQAARGVLVHSRHSLSLAHRDYQPNTLHNWHRVPMLSRPSVTVSEAAVTAVRERFSLTTDSRLICSFGYVGPSKLSLELIEAFGCSGLGRQGWSLILAGSDGGNIVYRRSLEHAIRAASLQGQVHVTGWIDTEVYWCLQKLSTINVQLRSRSRGETSAAVMDCLQSGAALVVNRHGSLDDLPDAVCRKLPDHFSCEQLASVLRELACDPQARAVLGEQGLRLCNDFHRPDVCAEAYRSALETIYDRPAHRLDVALALGQQAHFRRLPRVVRADVINQVAERLPAWPAPRRLYVDVSAIAEHDLGTGIQRVTSCLCRELFRLVPPGWIVEPVQAPPHASGYRTAPAYTGALLGIPSGLLPESEPVLPGQGDLFLGLDLHHAVVEAHADWYSRIQAHGAQVWFVLYDLLPCQLPDCFPPGTDALHHRWLETITRANGALCISRTVADELRAWINTHQSRSPIVRWFHLGSDPAMSDRLVSPSRWLRKRASLCQPRSWQLLMVGTIEPRKGYHQVLEAMQVLWERGVPLALTIIGREGWRDLPDDQRRSLPATIELLHQLGRQYPQQLRWFNAASDDELLASYHRADALLAASYGEGFGLPLVEARRHGLPVIARDIPVFREVLADDGQFFCVDCSGQLADWLEAWLRREELAHQQKSLLGVVAAPDSSPASGLTWQQSCRQLLEAIGLEATVNYPGGLDLLGS